MVTWKQDTLVWRCGDDRYDGEDPRYIQTLPAGKHLTCFGCSKAFVEEQIVRDFFFLELDTLKQIGKRPRRLVIVDHLTCLAYGQNDDLAAHQRNLWEMARLVRTDPRSEDLELFLKIHNMSANFLIAVALPMEVERVALV